MAISPGEGDLIAAIYDTAVDPSGWDEVVRRIVEATKSAGGVLIVKQGDAAHFAASSNFDPFYADVYLQTYYKKDFLNVAAARLAPGEVWTATHITRTDSFKASAFCNEFALPQGFADAVAVSLLRMPGKSWLLGLLRSPDAVWVEPAAWQLLETLVPHLKRAAAIHDVLSQAKAATDSLAAAVAAAGFAIFLLTGDCRVLFANAKAEDFLRRQIGLRYENGRLAVATPWLTARLHALAREGSQPGSGEGDIGGTLELRGENCPPLLAHVIRLAPSRAAAIFDINRPAAAVFVVDPAAGLCAQIDRFAARFGLSIAETRVLAEIIGGDGLLAAAAKLKITAATARTHVSRILAKTGTSRQTELIRRFFETSLRASATRI